MVEKRSNAKALATAKIGRVVTAFVLTLGSAIAAFGQASSPTSGAIRLTFPPGSTRIAASGTVSANGQDRYEVDVSAGQPLMLHLDSAPSAVAMGVTDASTKNELPGTGQGRPTFKRSFRGAARTTSTSRQGVHKRWGGTSTAAGMS